MHNTLAGFRIGRRLFVEGDERPNVRLGSRALYSQIRTPDSNAVWKARENLFSQDNYPKVLRL